MSALLIVLPQPAASFAGPSAKSLSDISPAAVGADLQSRGIDLSNGRGPQSLRDAMIAYSFVAGNGANLSANNGEILSTILKLNAAFGQTALESHVSVQTGTTGARIHYQLIGRDDTRQMNELTNRAEDDISIGLYYVWAERNGHPTSPKDAVFRIIQARTTLQLEEHKP